MSGNTGNLQALSIEVGNAETELTFAQAQVQSEIFNVLTAEQKQTIAERRKQMEARRAEMMKRDQPGGQFQVPVQIRLEPESGTDHCCSARATWLFSSPLLDDFCRLPPFSLSFF